MFLGHHRKLNPEVMISHEKPPWGIDNKICIVHAYIHITLFKLGKIFSILKVTIIKLNIYIHFIYCFTRLPSGKPMIELYDKPFKDTKWNPSCKQLQKLKRPLPKKTS